MNSKLKLVLMTAILIFGVGSISAVYAAPPTDACSLLTPAQVGGALGVPARSPVSPTRLDCIWPQAGAAAPGKGKGVMLTILGTLGPKATPIDRFNSAKKGGKFKGTPQPISGIGDDALYLASEGGTELYVKKGAFVFKVRVVGFPPQETQGKEKTLALDILAKL